MSVRTAHVAVIGGYMPFFDAIMPAGFRSGRDAFARHIAGLVDTQPVYLGLVDSIAAGEAAGRALAAGAPDAVVVVPTMATPAGYVWAALRDLPGLPVVLVNAHELDAVPPEYDMPALCRHSSNVGTLMVANILHRHGRRPDVVSGHLSDGNFAARIADAVLAATTAGALRGLRLGRLGRPLDAYLNVDLAAEDAARLGIDLVDIGLAEWTDTVGSVAPDRIAALMGMLRACAGLPEPDQDLLAAVRMAAALEMIVERHALDAGAINCRGKFGVDSPDIASLGCLAISHVTTIGCPFTCTGDLPTAVAMWLGKRLGGGALYCELDAIDRDRGAFLCANTGEGDFAYSAGPATCEVFPAAAYSGRPSPGCCVSTRLPVGAATMIGLSPDARRPEGVVIAAIEGRTKGTPDAALRISSAWFRPNLQPPEQAFDRWVVAGATHHGSLSPGRLAGALAKVAAHAGIGFAGL